MSNIIVRIVKKTYRIVLKRPLYHIKLFFYWAKLPQRIKAIREKDSIKVMFIIGGVNSWKTEMLYREMEKHSRFIPIVGVTSNEKYPYAKKELIEYLVNNNYKYIDLGTTKEAIHSFSPDIIFYGSPYSTGYCKGHYFNDNLQYVFCGVDYCLNITKHVAHLEHPWYDYCWQFYVEHEDVAKRKREILGYRARNIKVTGVPIVDMLLLPKENFRDPWKDQGGRKRIIYAPHHSFKGSNGDGIEFATFMEYGELMLDLAKKYQDKVTIAFKPHSFLYLKLVNIWGKERTDNYYKAWEELPNTQYENGEYVDLFKYSDAIIHDCASFILEYLYIDNPSLYLVSENNNLDDMFDFVREGYECYSHAYKAEDIELFIQQVISGKDPMHFNRRNFIESQLLPPNGKTACENIINAILYE